MKLSSLFKRKSQDITINFSSAFSQTDNFRFVMGGKGRRNFAGGATGRLQADWSAKTTTRNDKIRISLRNMRVRSRDAVENDEHALKYLSLCETNIIGSSGLMLKMQVMDDAGSHDTVANKLIEAAWKEWNQPENCTVARNMSWWALQQMLVKEEPQAGEFFVRKVRGFKNKFGFALQIIEADCVDEQLNLNLANGNRIRMGIEYNGWDEVVAYHVLTENPYESLGGGSLKHERIPAGDIIHKFIPLGVKQKRGVPWFHASMDSMHMLDRYDESAIIAARMGAANGGFFEETPDANGQYAGDDEDEEGNPVMDISPGQFVQLPRGIKFNQYESPYPDKQYGGFVKVRLQTIAAGLRGANYNQLTGDYESVNYSSLRAAFLESQDVWKAMQRHFEDCFAREVFKEWLMEALLRGVINLPAAKFPKFNQPKFIGRGWPWVDPQVEIAAAKEAIAIGVSSQSHIISEQGGDIETIFNEQQGDKQLAKEKNLNFDGDKQKLRADTIATLARAGAITPCRDDEEANRNEFNLPEASQEVEAAWDKSDGVRIPVTVQTPDNFQIGNNGAGKAGAAAPPAK
jgi:lambda family phage portal protein